MEAIDAAARLILCSDWPMHRQSSVLIYVQTEALPLLVERTRMYYRELVQHALPGGRLFLHLMRSYAPYAPMHSVSTIWSW